MSLSIHELWMRIVASGLATEADRSVWYAHVAQLSSHSDAYDAVQAWLGAGLLTAFQSQEILEGKPTPLGLGPYILLERLGQGGMGAVYRARHRVMDREVAIKLIHPHRLDSGEAIRRFQREVAATARLEHPRIVRAYDAGAFLGTHYLAMELVNGQDLATVVSENGPMAWENAADCVRQVAEALAFAHSKGIIHRDIKPGNLLLDHEGNIKVLDLGLASCIDGNESRMTETGQTMGTADYIAPEQARDARSADERSDIYSLGMTLWTLLTDTTPYCGSFAAKLLAHQQSPPPDLASVCSNVPDWLVAIFHKMVAKNPSDRLPSMRALVSLIEARCVLSPEANTAPSVSAVWSRDALEIDDQISRRVPFSFAMSYSPRTRRTLTSRHSKGRVRSSRSTSITANALPARRSRNSDPFPNLSGSTSSRSRLKAN